MFMRTGNKLRRTGSSCSSLNSDFVSSAKTRIAPSIPFAESDDSKVIRELRSSGQSSGQSACAMVDRANPWSGGSAGRLCVGGWIRTDAVRIRRSGSDRP